MLYMTKHFNLPEDGMRGARINRNYPEGHYGEEDRAFSEHACCQSCQYTDYQHSVGDYESNPKLMEDFWKFHLRDKPECSENREVVTFITPLIRQQEKELEEFEDVQIP